jgi:TonB family protein
MTVYELWEKVFPYEKRWLGLILFVSLLGHLAAFFIFQIQPVDARTPLERPHRLTWISASSVQGGEMVSDPFAWIRWRDPSAIALPQSNVPDPPPLEEEGWSRSRRALPPLAPFNPLETNQPGREFLLGSVLESIRHPEVEEMPLAMEAPPKLSGTVVVLRRTLENRNVIRKVELPRPETRESLRSTIYFLEVMPSGLVLNVRIDQSCGNTEIDQLGLEKLRQWRFAPEPGMEDSVWGRVDVFWDYREPNPDQVEFRF